MWIRITIVRSWQAAPMATPTRFCSAMKHSMWRSDLSFESLRDDGRWATFRLLSLEECAAQLLHNMSIDDDRVEAERVAACGLKRFTSTMTHMLSMPAPTATTCPNEPVPTSTKGKRGAGWRSKSESILRKFWSSAIVKSSASAHAAYKIGTACPFERMT